GVEFEAALRVAGDQAQAPARAAFGVGQRPLAEVVEGQQRTAEGGGFDPETLRAGGQELKAQRAAQDLMFALVQTREVAPSDDARAVDGGGREIRALAQRYFGDHPAARKVVDQMSMSAE